MLMILDYLKTRYLDEKGQGMVEYALILAFVAIIAAGLTGQGNLATSISSVFTKVQGLFGTTGS